MTALETTLASLMAAQKKLEQTDGATRNAALLAVAAALGSREREILDANAVDVDAARRSGMKEALVERLLLTSARIADMAVSLEHIAALPDPLGKIVSGKTLANGLLIEEITVPLGVVAIIYESRPNVTVDAFAVAYKAGCAILLRGSRTALNSNRALRDAVVLGLKKPGGIPEAAALTEGGHDEVDEILAARGMLDAVLPRGGHSLIRRVVENARVPVLETGEGNCHIYVHSDADLDAAVPIIDNAKTQRPGACNALETLLVHTDCAARLLPKLAKALAGRVELRCDKRAMAALPEKIPGLAVKPAEDADWETEFLDFILAVKVTDSLDEAITHVNRYGTGHSEAILTTNIDAARRFQREVDAACVYANASTRFTDGGEFGMGAELGISTQKFHARGPMGMSALTTTKYLIHGNGHVRK